MNPGAAQPAPGSQRHGEDEVTHGGTEQEPALGWTVQRCLPCCAGDQTGGAKVPSGSRALVVEARDGEAPIR